MFNAAHLLLQIPSPLKSITVTFNNQKANLLELNLLTSSMNISREKRKKIQAGYNNAHYNLLKLQGMYIDEYALLDNF